MGEPSWQRSKVCIVLDRGEGRRGSMGSPGKELSYSV